MEQQFKRIKNVTAEIAKNWRKHYVCIERQVRVYGVACREWRTILNDTEQLQHTPHFPIISARRDAECGEGSVSLYQSGWVITEYRKHVEIGLLVEPTETDKTQLAISTKIKHLQTGSVFGNQIAAKTHEPIQIETPGCVITMTITNATMEGSG